MCARTQTRGRRPLARRLTARPVRAAGMTLIELMVALAIGLFLMMGAFTVYLHTRATFQLSETVARLQENGRFALDTIEPDVRMGHYWGLTARTEQIGGRAGPADAAAFAIGGYDCGPNWAVNLDADIAGTNDGDAWTCASAAYPPAAAADTLVVRRASENAAAPPLDAKQLYVQSALVQDGLLFDGRTTIPAGYAAATSETHALVVDGYYVSRSSTLGPNVPSLRVMRLVAGGAGDAGPRIEDQEIMPGIEDMQVQFGLDLDPPGAANRGSIDMYVNPGDARLEPGSAGYDPNARILAVRLWLRVRAERPEPGYEDDAPYAYGDAHFDAPKDAYRRIVVSKTIFIRNARSQT